MWSTPEVLAFTVTLKPMTHSLKSRWFIYFRKKGEKTPGFVRFSTLVGSQGSPDLVRDVRGFAVKFYTKKGNLGLLGNNIPLFLFKTLLSSPILFASPRQNRILSFQKHKRRMIISGILFPSRWKVFI